jgi:hypothetical protein
VRSQIGHFPEEVEQLKAHARHQLRRLPEIRACPFLSMTSLHTQGGQGRAAFGWENPISSVFWFVKRCVRPFRCTYFCSNPCGGRGSFFSSSRGSVLGVIGPQPGAPNIFLRLPGVMRTGNVASGAGGSTQAEA